eukprot:4949235-Pyramimonas_sp.AAC.1
MRAKEALGALPRTLPPYGHAVVFFRYAGAYPTGGFARYSTPCQKVRCIRTGVLTWRSAKSFSPGCSVLSSGRSSSASKWLHEGRTHGHHQTNVHERVVRLGCTQGDRLAA